MSESYYEVFKKVINGTTQFFQSFANVLEACHNWYQKNEETISIYLSIFAEFEIWSFAYQELAENQIVFTDDLNMGLARAIYNSPDVNIIVQEYYFGNHEEKMTHLIERCEEASQMSEYKVLYDQTVDAYKRGHYHLACVGVFTIVDGVLADVSDMIAETSFKRRIMVIEQKLGNKVELNDVDRKTLCIFTAVDSLQNSIFGNSRFSEDEPTSLNRHWIIHGRTRKTYTQYDFLKILLCLDAIIFLSDLSAKNDDIDKSQI